MNPCYGLIPAIKEFPVMDFCNKVLQGFVNRAMMAGRI